MTKPMDFVLSLLGLLSSVTLCFMFFMWWKETNALDLFFMYGSNYTGVPFLFLKSLTFSIIMNVIIFTLVMPIFEIFKKNMDSTDR